MQCSQVESGGAQRHDANAEHYGRLPRGRSQVVRAPSESFRRIVMNDKADDQPHWKYHPRIRMAELQPPDVPADENGKSKSFGEREQSEDFFARHRRLKPACDNYNSACKSSDVMPS